MQGGKGARTVGAAWAHWELVVGAGAVGLLAGAAISAAIYLLPLARVRLARGRGRWRGSGTGSAGCETPRR